MPILDHRVTDELRLLVSALGRPRDSAEVRAALDQVHRWSEHELLSETEGGTDALVSYQDGVRLDFSTGGLGVAIFEVQENPAFAAFAHPEQLLEGLVAGQDQSQLRARLGEPLTSAYGNDLYLVDEGRELFLTYRPDGSLQRVFVRDTADVERRRLVRKARARQKKLSAAVGQRIEVSDEDGILAMIDPSTYRSHLPGWDFDSLSQHLASEMNAQRAMVWMTGSDGYGEWTIELREHPSQKDAFREAEQVVDVVSGRLSVVGYTQLTQAADDESVSLSDESVGWSFAVDDGTYSLRIRQMFDPEDHPADPVELPLWWVR